MAILGTLAATVAVIAVAGAAPFSPRDDSLLPMQHRLAYAGHTGMHVSWNTYDKLSKPAVKYGVRPDYLNQIALSDVSVTYHTSTTYNNHVKITGLKPDTLYYYLPLHDNCSAPHTFRTSRPSGDLSPMTVAVVVDLGTMGKDGLTTHVGKGADNPLKPGEINTIESLVQHKKEFDFLWHPGDIAYADYWLKEEIQHFLPNTTIADGAKVYERILNDFYSEMSRITIDRPYMVGPGNHEANCDNGGTKDKEHNITYDVSICMPGQTNFTGYRNHFRMPSDVSRGTGNFWYSFDHGMVHFVQIDTETDLGHGFIGPDEPGGSEGEDSGPFNPIMNAQSKWLMADLAAVDRSKTPWIVVSGHRPFYANAGGDPSTICFDCIKVFEPIFHQYKVDLVLSGHFHVYQRNMPVYQNKTDPRGLQNPTFPWYITNGAAGHYDGLDTLVTPGADYTAFALDTTYGWSKLVFHNCTHMSHEFVASGNGTVLDSATLFKDRKCKGYP